MKLHLVLFATAVLAASAVHARFPLNKEVFTKLALMQDETEGGDDDGGVVATPTNGTLQSILQELNSNKRVRRGTGCYAAGPYGGGGGGGFHELIDNCQSLVKRIVVRSGSRVDSIEMIYQLSNGQQYNGGHRGGYGGGEHVVDINFNAGERIIGIFGQSGSELDNIGFTTNHGNIFGPYGGNGGGRFSVSNCVLRGFFGRSGSRIDSIGFYCARLKQRWTLT